jgi:hypothetical protein
MSGHLVRPHPARRSRTALLVVAAVAAAVVPAGGAHAAPVKCKITSYTPGKFILGPAETLKYFTVSTSSGCKPGTWKIKFDENLVLDAATGVTGLQVDPTGLTNEEAGVGLVTVSAKSKTSGAKRGTKDVKFYLQRRSTWGTTFNVGPEPAGIGDTLDVTGTLKRISWGDKPTYGRYAGRKVKVQFKAKGTKTFVTIKNTTTDEDGRVATTVTIRKSGAWRLRYSGNTTTGRSDSKIDRILID